MVAAIRLHHDLDALGESRISSDAHNLIAMGLLAEFIVRRHEGVDQDADWDKYGEAAMNWLETPMSELLTWEDELREILDNV